MSYTKPNRIKYTFPSLDWGNSVSERFGVLGPKGKTGRLHDYGLEGITETVSGAVTAAIGTAADPDAYGEEFSFDAAADLTSKSVRSTYDSAEDKTAFDAVMVNRNLPADTAVILTMTGVAGAGIGTPFMIIDWAD